MLEFAIELRPHVGEYQDRRLGVRQVVFPQSLLFYHDAELERANGNPWLHIGYVGDATDSIEFLPQAHGLGTEQLDAVTRRVGEMTGRPRAQHLPPKPVANPQRRAVKELDADR